jgi:hypothetical protein
MFVWHFGDRYEGEYRNGKPNGKGTYTWKDGSKYEGEWRHGKKHGKGKFTWPEVPPAPTPNTTRATCFLPIL